jgi:hypothetical protein
MKPRECPSAAVLPCCRPAVPCCRAAVLPCCRAAPQAYRQTPRWTYLPRHTGRQRAGRIWTAANLPHECTRVRCDVSGSCLSKLCCAPITRCKAGLGATATDDAPCPPHASVPKMLAKSIFAGLILDRVSCGQAVFLR